MIDRAINLKILLFRIFSYVILYKEFCLIRNFWMPYIKTKLPKNKLEKSIISIPNRNKPITSIIKTSMPSKP